MIFGVLYVCTCLLVLASMSLLEFSKNEFIRAFVLMIVGLIAIAGGCWYFW